MIWPTPPFFDRVMLLKQEDKNSSPEWLNKLPQMVKQLEVSLYRSAPSFEAYCDTSTLKHRLQVLAMEIARKTQQPNISGGNGPVHVPSGGGSSGGHTSTETVSQLSQQGVAPQRLVAPQRPGLQGMPNYSLSAGSGLALPSLQGQNSQMVPQGQQMLRQRQIQDQAQRGQVVNIGEVNSLVAGKSSSVPTGLSPSSTAPMASTARSPTGLPGNSPIPSSLGPGVTGNSHSQFGDCNGPEWQIRIRHKQQRLLLLHHSSKCLHEDGRCAVTAHCADMKRLWKHMARCTDNNCRVSHCFSSRSILSHYRKCKDHRCPACGPVRETVKKSQAKVVKQPKGPELPQGTSMGLEGNVGALIGSMGNNMNGGFDNLRQQPNHVLPGSAMQLPQQQQRLYSMSNVLSPSNNTSSFLGSRDRSRLPDLDQGHQVLRSLQSPNAQHTSKIMSPQAGPRQAPPLQSLGDVDGSTGLLTARLEDDLVSESSGKEKQQASGNRNDKEWQSKIRHKQQRLLLLRHASKCPYENVTCKVTPYCGRMKELWRHISVCKNRQCKVQHCMSSRYVLGHYRRCKDAQCPACGPVRITIRQIQEKENKEKDKPAGSSGEFLEFDLGINYTGNILQEPSTPPISGPQPSPSGLVKNVNNPPPMELPPQHPKPKRPKPDPSLTPPTPSSTVTVVSSESRSNSVVSGGSVQAPVLCELVSQKSKPVSSVSPEKSSKSGASTIQEKLSSPTMSVSNSKSSDEHTFSLINSFTVEEIEEHIDSLNRTCRLSPAKLKSRYLEMLKGLMSHKHGWVFNTPVDPVELGLPDYFDVIKRPMDLGTILKKLDSNPYHSIDDFEADVRLTFENAITYNETGSDVHDMAKELITKLDADCGRLLEQLRTEKEERRKNTRACSLCGSEKLLFETPVFFCNGINCSSKRIRRNSHFYLGGNNQYYWCNQCFNELDNSIELGDLTLKKEELKKKKNDEVHEESWVACDSCERWIHQICGLFNSRQNKENQSVYNCPHCLLEKKKTKTEERTHGPKKMLSAENLPRTKLSEHLENRVRKIVKEKHGLLAQENAEAEVRSAF